jgi:hypothetical protein
MELTLFGRGAIAVLALAAAFGCGTEGKKTIAKSAIESMGPEERRESFEATVRMLDEKPALIDEVYSVVRTHPATMHRFIANASRDLKDPGLANMTAELLAKEPASVEQTMIASLDAVAKQPEARRAMRRAMVQRAGKAVDILTDDPETLGRVLAASMTIVEEKPLARDNVLRAVRQQRRGIIAFVKSDPELSKEMTEELLREAVKDKPALDKLLRATGVIDEDVPSPSKGKKRR